MSTLPKPSGPYLVGSCTQEVCDSGRPSHILGRQPGRALFVKIWYPAEGSSTEVCERERLWEQLRADPNMPGAMRLLLGPAMKRETNSYRGAAYCATAGSPRVVIYSHGLISFASENTTLMEQLASHGLTVLALQHREQLPELRALQQAQDAREKQEQKDLERQIKRADEAQRPALWSRYFRLASNTNRIVFERAADIGYVVANIDPLLATVPNLERGVHAEVVGLLGLSLGGAVATEYSKGGGAGARCVVNIDGGIYGALLDTPLAGRYMMLYSEQNAGVNEAALAVDETGSLATVTIPGTKHLNFHDFAAVYPLLRWLGATGRAKPGRVLEERNELVTEFLLHDDRALEPESKVSSGKDAASRAISSADA